MRVNIAATAPRAKDFDKEYFSVFSFSKWTRFLKSLSESDNLPMPFLNNILSVHASRYFSNEFLSGLILCDLR